MFLLQRIYLQRVPGRFPQQCFLQRLLHSQGRCLRSKPFVSFKTAAQGGEKEKKRKKKKNSAKKHPTRNMFFFVFFPPSLGRPFFFCWPLRSLSTEVKL